MDIFLYTDSQRTVNHHSLYGLRFIPPIRKSIACCQHAINSPIIQQRQWQSMVTDIQISILRSTGHHVLTRTIKTIAIHLITPVLQTRQDLVNIHTVIVKCFGRLIRVVFIITPNRCRPTFRIYRPSVWLVTVEIRPIDIKSSIRWVFLGCSLQCGLILLYILCCGNQKPLCLIYTCICT